MENSELIRSEFYHWKANIFFMQLSIRSSLVFILELLVQ